MANLNKVMLMGNLTRDPQLSYLPSQTPVVEFGIATTRRFKKQDGSQGEETCFVDCQMFGKRAEVVNQYFKKGEPIFVEGRLKFDQWTAQDGAKRSKLRVFVENFEFLGGRRGGGQQQTSAPDEPTQDAPYGGGMDDDIPF
jgi:single-strand DNA-binding protein